MWVAADSFVFFPIFISAGVAIGIAMDNTRSEREKNSFL